MPRLREDDDPFQEPRDLNRMEGHVVSAAATALTALVALANPAAGIAAAVSQPAMDWAMRKAWAEVFRSRAGRVEAVLDVASETSNTPAADVVRRLQSTDEGAELLLSAAEAAMATTIPGKLRALGRSLAAASEDASILDEELIFVSAVRALQQPHMMVLRHQQERDEAEENYLPPELDEDARVHFPDGMGREQFLMWIAVPIAYGLIRQYSVWSGDATALTPFGRLFLQRATEAAHPPAPGTTA